ncbi:DUF2218 domain-containing protein [Pseudorhodobacter turbinis]|uniref:DUF2218 domain-containing protein n=1 Tax=Pseudorhodobacter turbinis TaxID=2500533 RepID=A0A4P8EDE1_9RHOB|nr:DUF2218 domain-containing protein [Pseudorhodobacter turbinis]QCO54752.1 DUF2218 domain-containing protein [Pseudorhodobacter turbinis]
MLTSTAHYPTEHASKYLQQLCKHFAHKVTVENDAHRGSVALEAGPAELTADENGLTIRVTAEDAKGIIGARFVFDIHLVTFAHREGFTGLSWAMLP